MHGEQLERIHSSGFIAILRGPDPEALIQRGVDLNAVGCTVIEVTLDSTDALHVLHSLASNLPDDVLLGVGTVMHPLTELPEAAAAGARFAVSPIHPEHLVEAARAVDVLPVPGAATPDELWRANFAGAPLVKLFPASTQWSPAALRSLPAPLRAIRTLPTGGIAPADVEAWLDAGAFACGIGGSLTPENAAGLIERIRAMTG